MDGEGHRLTRVLTSTFAPTGSFYLVAQIFSGSTPQKAKNTRKERVVFFAFCSVPLFEAAVRLSPSTHCRPLFHRCAVSHSAGLRPHSALHSFTILAHPCYNVPMTTQDEIAQLLAEDEISTETAVRLILKSQAKMQTDIKLIAANSDNISEHHTRYPSVLWLFAHRRKETVATALAIFTLFYSVFTPITISDLRHAIAAAIGIPIP